MWGDVQQLICGMQNVWEIYSQFKTTEKLFKSFDKLIRSLMCSTFDEFIAFRIKCISTLPCEI